jgi:ketosteroid isomerase-like protein
MRCILILTGVAALSALACSTEEVQPVIDAAAIEAELRQFERDYVATGALREVEPLLAYYAEDAVFLPPGDRMQYGREWVRTILNELFTAYDFEEVFHILQFKPLGDRVLAIYEYSSRGVPKGAGDAFEEQGIGMALLKRSETGGWQFEWNAWNVIPQGEVAETH